jgi:hypothetical protein
VAQRLAKTKIANPIDIHLGSRVRMRRLMLNLSHEKTWNPSARVRARESRESLMPSSPRPWLFFCCDSNGRMLISLTSSAAWR